MRLRIVAMGMSTLLVGLTAAAALAEAAPGVITQGMNLRAGPGIDYPLVAQLPQGTPIEIFGCLEGWSWCDVATEGVRGWVAGAGLQLLYDDRPEPLYGYGAAVGLPFIGFDVDRYWGRYYRGRPWFHDAGRWRGQGRDEFGGRDRAPGPPVAIPYHGEPGVGHPVGPATFQGHGPEPGRGPAAWPERGPERGPEREPGVGHPEGPATFQGQGPEPGRGPAAWPERGPEREPGVGHPEGPATFQGHGPEPGRGPAAWPERGPERGPEPAGPAMRAGPEPARAPPPAPRPEPRPQAEPPGGHPAPGRPDEGRGGHDQPPH